MGIKRIALFLLLFTAIWAKAQQITEQSFQKEIDGVEFASMKLLHYLQDEEGITAYFVMSRIGAIRAKVGFVWQGANEPAPIHAVSAMKFDHDLKLTETELVYLEPEDEPAGDYELLKEPVQFGSKEVLATKEQVISRRGLAKRFPDLARMEQKKEAKTLNLPEEFYDNTLLYTNFGNKVKSFDERIYRYQDPVEAAAKQSWFSKLISAGEEDTGPEFNHKLESDEYNMESYRDASKEQWWVRMSGPFSDPISGNVIAHNYRYMRKKFAAADPRGYYEEVVTFDAAGKEAQRIEIEFEKPYKFAGSWHFQKDAPDYDLKRTEGVFLLYEGNPSRKDKSVSKTARKAYFVKPDGTLAWSHDFELPTEKMRLFNAQMSGNHVILMGISWKPTTLHIFTLDESGLHNHQTFADDHATYKAVGTTPIAGGFNYREVKRLKDTEGHHIFIHNMSRKTRENTLQNPNAPEITVDEGYLMLKFDQEGNLTHASRIERSKNAARSKSVGLKILEETDEALSFLYLEPVNVTINKEQTLRVTLKALKMNKADLKITGHDVKAPLLLDVDSYFINQEEKAIYLFAENLDKGELRLVKYPVK